MVVNKTPGEVALTEGDLPGWTLVGEAPGPDNTQLILKFAKEGCGEIDQLVRVRPSDEEAGADFNGTYFTDGRWLTDHTTVGDESELWVCRNVAHARFRVQNIYVEIVLSVGYSDFEATPPVKEYALWLADVVEHRILDLTGPDPATLVVDTSGGDAVPLELVPES